MTPLFDSDSLPRFTERLAEGAVLLRGFASLEAPALLGEVARIADSAPFRRLVTPGGYTMSVAMTNCGRVGWVSDSSGYRYDPANSGELNWRRKDRVCPCMGHVKDRQSVEPPAIKT